MTKELEIALPIRPGHLDRAAVRRVQEWLCYHHQKVVIDGEYGPATATAVRAFQLRRASVADNGVEEATWRALTSPISDVLKPIEVMASDSVRTMVVKYAIRHEERRPVEIGGENRGPWVRLYMAGNEGREWPWCAGFATFILRQACEQLGKPMPVPYRFGCDELAGLAQKAGSFRTGVTPELGWLFLVRGRANHWQHIGIVAGTDRAGTMTTIEGNTNDDGSAEGYEVCRRTRSYLGKDFIRID